MKDSDRKAIEKAITNLQFVLTYHESLEHFPALHMRTVGNQLLRDGKETEEECKHEEEWNAKFLKNAS